MGVQKEKKKDYYMIEKNGVSIQENFLEEKEFTTLVATITHSEFPWYFNPSITIIDKESSPGMFSHNVYNANTGPISSTYNSIFLPILEQLGSSVTILVRINLNPRLPQSFYSIFHSDTENYLDKEISAQWTTSILYINTNNGYTEFENSGERIESVANRLVTFPSDSKHRGITQTDEQTRIVINFNYLKRSTLSL